jgi:hypothetical protein
MEHLLDKWYPNYASVFRQEANRRLAVRLGYELNENSTTQDVEKWLAEHKDVKVVELPRRADPEEQ